MLHTKHELYATAKGMVGSLGDQYSEFLDPAAFRAAVKRPTKAELDYLSQQAVGATPPHPDLIPLHQAPAQTTPQYVTHELSPPPAAYLYQRICAHICY